jgi:hypothetical protein
MGLFKDCGCGCNGAEQQKKFTASILSGLLFFIIANPETFTIVRRIFGKWVASATGYPTMLGLLLHAVIFFLIVWGIMNLKKERADGVPAPMKDSSADMMMGLPPPPPVPEEPATPDGLLPPMDEPEQPYASIPTSPMTSSMTTQGTMSRMSNMFGGKDITSEIELAPAPPVTGSNWRQCACGDGTQVMILK